MNRFNHASRFAFFLDLEDNITVFAAVFIKIKQDGGCCKKSPVIA